MRADLERVIDQLDSSTARQLRKRKARDELEHLCEAMRTEEDVLFLYPGNVNGQYEVGYLVITNQRLIHWTRGGATILPISDIDSAHDESPGLWLQRNSSLSVSAKGRTYHFGMHNGKVAGSAGELIARLKMLGD
jgi:hypothetical protein